MPNDAAARTAGGTFGASRRVSDAVIDLLVSLDWGERGRQELADIIFTELRRGVFCGDCGRGYETFDLDVIVPHEIWKQICPDHWDGEWSGGILCAGCIVKRASKLPGITVGRITFE